jgi:hypothetical protein
MPGDGFAAVTGSVRFADCGFGPHLKIHANSQTEFGGASISVRISEGSMKKTTEQTHAFTLILSGLSGLTEAACDAFFVAGCNDALPGVLDGAVFLDFDRKAPSSRDAILSAIHAVESTALGVRVVRVESEGSRRIAAAINAALELRRHTRTAGEATGLCEFLESGRRGKIINGRVLKDQ